MSSGYGLTPFTLSTNPVLPTPNLPKNQKVGETGIHLLYIPTSWWPYFSMDQNNLNNLSRGPSKDHLNQFNVFLTRSFKSKF